MVDISKINTSKAVIENKKTVGKSSTGKSSFSSFLTAANEISDSSAASSVSETSSVDNLFIIQEIDEADKHAKKKLIKRAETLIEKLEKIREALLFGTISKDELIKTAQFLRERKEIVQDKKLSEIIEEIELRVEVELAKLISWLLNSKQINNNLVFLVN